MSLENTHLGAKKIKELMQNKSSVFFVGIGGINMSSLAHMTHASGRRVGGSDRCPSALCTRLEKEGITIFYEHSETNVEGFDALVYTVAISPDNPEYNEARSRGIPCISRADYMGYLMSEYGVRIGISGMHGKSSTTSMCAQALIEAKKDPTVLSGAELACMGGAYRVGGRDYFLFEACEYMDSFLDFSPTLSVILNIELDHVDYFEDIEHIKRSYRAFAELSHTCVANVDDPNVCSALEGYGGTLVSFGVEREADFRAVSLALGGRGSSFDVMHGDTIICHVDLKVWGKHNVYNALAAVAALCTAGVEPEAVASALGSFCGAARRMEYKGSLGGAEFFDDYGHHPTEIESTLSGVKSAVKGKLICAFQSHTYSRTAALFDDFARSLAIADKVIITDIYSARETDTLGMSSEVLACAVERCGATAAAVHSFEEAAELLRIEATHGDTVIIMGAGDVWHIFDYLTLSTEAYDERM